MSTIIAVAAYFYVAGCTGEYLSDKHTAARCFVLSLVWPLWLAFVIIKTAKEFKP